MFARPLSTQLVQVGPMGRQPISFDLYSPSSFLASSLSSATQGSSLWVKGSKLPGTMLDEARELLKCAKNTYVPSHTQADGWVKEYEKFCSGNTSPEKWDDFVALLLLRTSFQPEEKGHLHITSAYTYMRYVLQDRRFYRHSFAESTKALETKAGKIGPIRKAPSLGVEHAENILKYIHTGDAADLKLRSGLWCQVATGGRRVDVSRLGQNCMNWTDGFIDSIHWRWTKSIKNPGNAKLCPTLDEVRSMAGPPPFTEDEWIAWCSADAEGCGLSSYSNNAANTKLDELSNNFTERATTTSLRDIFHRILAQVHNKDSNAMVRFTQHRTGKTLQSVYQERRKLSVPKATAPKKATKKTPAKSGKVQKRKQKK